MTIIARWIFAGLFLTLLGIPLICFGQFADIGKMVFSIAQTAQSTQATLGIAKSSDVGVGNMTLGAKIALYAQIYGVSREIAEGIISCESSNDEKAVNLNKNGSRDWGYWQINDRLWADFALTKGFDIYNADQNLEFGFWLMKKYGTQPWYLSSGCWR